MALSSAALPAGAGCPNSTSGCSMATVDSRPFSWSDAPAGVRSRTVESQVPEPWSDDAAADVRGGLHLAYMMDVVRIGGVAGDDGQADLGAGRAAQTRHAFTHGHLARRDVADGAQVVAGPQPGFGGGGVVARRDDAQVVLPRELEADLARGLRRVRFDLLHFVGGEKRAIRIEAVGQAAHRAVHHL